MEDTCPKHDSNFYYVHFLLYGCLGDFRVEGVGAQAYLLGVLYSARTQNLPCGPKTTSKRFSHPSLLLVALM